MGHVIFRIHGGMVKQKIGCLSPFCFTAIHRHQMSAFSVKTPVRFLLTKTEIRCHGSDADKTVF